MQLVSEKSLMKLTKGASGRVMGMKISLEWAWEKQGEDNRKQEDSAVFEEFGCNVKQRNEIMAEGMWIWGEDFFFFKMGNIITHLYVTEVVKREILTTQKREGTLAEMKSKNRWEIIFSTQVEELPWGRSTVSWPNKEKFSCLTQ